MPMLPSWCLPPSHDRRWNRNVDSRTGTWREVDLLFSYASLTPAFGLS